MKDCYAVYLIRWFNSLPEKDDRGFWKRLWHKWKKLKYPTKELFWADNPSGLDRNLIDNRHAWTQKDLGYE